MRVLRVHAPGTDARVASGIAAAVRAFNAGLDIRLRFLAIGIEESVLEIADAADAAASVSAAIGAATAGARPTDVVIVLGHGAASVAAATVAARERVPLVRVGAGDRSGAGADADRAADRLAATRLAHDAAGLSALRDEGLADGAEVVGTPDDPASGERIVRALYRARRR